MSAAWKRPAVWVVIPATWALALGTRSILWSSKVLGQRQNVLGHAVGHQFLFLGLTCLASHAAVTFARDHGDALPWAGYGGGQAAVAGALLDALAIGLLYATAFRAWAFNG